jgi:hypothetical protein
MFVQSLKETIMSKVSALPTRKHFLVACNTSLSLDIFLREHFKGSRKVDTKNYYNGRVAVTVEISCGDLKFTSQVDRSSLKLAMYQVFCEIDTQIRSSNPLFTNVEYWKNL